MYVYVTVTQNRFVYISINTDKLHKKYLHTLHRTLRRPILFHSFIGYSKYLVTLRASARILTPILCAWLIIRSCSWNCSLLQGKTNRFWHQNQKSCVSPKLKVLDFVNSISSWKIMAIARPQQWTGWWSTFKEILIPPKWGANEWGVTQVSGSRPRPVSMGRDELPAPPLVQPRDLPIRPRRPHLWTMCRLNLWELEPYR